MYWAEWGHYTMRLVNPSAFGRLHRNSMHVEAIGAHHPRIRCIRGRQGLEPHRGQTDPFGSGNVSLAAITKYTLDTASESPIVASWLATALPLDAWCGE